MRFDQAYESSGLRPVLYIGGTFDMFHQGHVRLLARARDIGEVTVALNTDSFIQEYKGRPPVMRLDERIEVVAGCRYVDDVVVNTGGWNSAETILKVKPDFIVHGDDWMGNEYLQQLGIDREFLCENEIGLIYLPYTQGVSTTELIRRCVCDSQSSERSTKDTNVRSLSSAGFTLKEAEPQTKPGYSVRTTETPRRLTTPAVTSDSAGQRGWSLKSSPPPSKPAASTKSSPTATRSTTP